MEFNNNSNNWITSMNKCLKTLVDNSNEDIKVVCNIVMEELLNVTRSQIGFVAELKYNDKGSPFFRYKAVCCKAILTVFEDYLKKHFLNNDNLDFFNMDTLYGLIYQTNKVIISNDVVNDKRRGGVCKLPEGHPFLSRFMGIPIKSNNKLIGMIGLANAPQDYKEEDIVYIEPFANIYSFIITSWRRRGAINSSRNRFLLHMSHEIKTPLNGIIGMTQHLLDTELTTEQLDIIDCISQCNLKLLTIINDIGDFYKISMGNIDLIMKPVKLNEVLDNVYGLYKTDIEQKNLTFSYLIDPYIKGDIITDKKRLTQILLNLLSNAIKYTQKGEIYIKINIDLEKSKTLVEQNKKYDKSIVNFEISDTGVGMSHDRLDVIFHDFENLDNGLIVDTNNGRGLGLSICRLLVKAFSGDIYIISTVGEGTTINFYIETELSDNIDVIKEYVKNKVNGYYGLVLSENNEDRITLSSILISIGMIPIIPNNEIEARMYVEKTDLQFRLMVVSKKYILDQIIMDIQKKYDDMVIIGISNNKISPIIDTYINIAFTEADVIKPLYELYKSKIFDFSDINQSSNIYKSTISSETITKFTANISNKKTNNIDGTMDIDNLYKNSSYLYNSLSQDYLKDNNTITILIAEDEIANQKVIKTVLLKLGFVYIDVVSDGQLMCQAANQKDYDVILIDIRMPIMDGYTATAEVIKNMKTQNRPIPIMIAVTALEDMFMKEKCTEVGIHYVLKKPFSFKDLSKIMKIVKNKKYKK